MNPHRREYSQVDPRELDDLGAVVGRRADGDDLGYTCRASPARDTNDVAKEGPILKVGVSIHQPPNSGRHAEAPAVLGSSK